MSQENSDKETESQEPTSPAGLKTCSKCEEEKFLDDFHTWHNSRDGYRRRCKLCTNEDNRNRHNANKRLHKECKLCNTEMPLSKARYCKSCRDRRREEVAALANARKRKEYEDIKCHECETPFSRFHENDKYCSAQCRWRARGPRKFRSWDFDKKRDYMLKYAYGIDQNKYEELLAEQGGGCAICGKTPQEEGRNLAVDHSHETGEIFGILCSVCNKILVGHIREPQMFERAAEYLSKGTGLFVPDDKVKPRKKRRRKTARKVKSVDKTEA